MKVHFELAVSQPGANLLCLEFSAVPAIEDRVLIPQNMAFHAWSNSSGIENPDPAKSLTGKVVDVVWLLNSVDQIFEPKVTIEPVIA